MRRFRRGIPIRIRKKGFGPAMRLITQLSLYKIPKLELETKPESGKTSPGSGYEVKVAILQLEDRPCQENLS